MAWRRVTVEDEREFLVKSYITKQAHMDELCKECGVSRKTGYKWVSRFLEQGQNGLKDRSRAPKNPKKTYADDQIQQILELKSKKPTYGPKKLITILEKTYPDIEWPGHTRLYQILKENGLVSSRKLRRRVPRTHPLADVSECNDTWCADFKGWFKTTDQVKVEPLTITDGHSRFIIKCLHIERKRAVDVWKVYSDAFHEYGLPLRMRTDNGPPFATPGAGRLSSLSVNLIKAGVTPEWINPGHPEENGRHERFHKTLKEAIANPPASNFPEQLQRIRAFVDEYNFDRPHEALNQECPGSYYQPSQRIWDGKLRSPEYDENSFTIRKVCPNGCIFWKRKACYIGQVISGEYVGLEEVDEGCFRVFYGPVYLGTFKTGEQLIKPKLAKEYWE